MMMPKAQDSPNFTLKKKPHKVHEVMRTVFARVQNSDPGIQGHKFIWVNGYIKIRTFIQL